MDFQNLNNYAYGMWPILIFAYCRLSFSEEKELKKKFGKTFLEYRKNVTAFIPKFNNEAKQ